MMRPKKEFEDVAELTAAKARIAELEKAFREIIERRGDVTCLQVAEKVLAGPGDS